MRLVINNLTKKFKEKTAVDSLSAELTPGVYGLLGANGAGKTTLMRMVCSVLKPTEGHIELDGFSAGSAEYRSALGYLPQDFGYYPDFTAMEFLLYMAAVKGLPEDLAKERSAELLGLVALDHCAGKKIKSFSGGMKRRLGIAQAMLADPKILVLDEPTAGLDPKERIRFRNIISGLGEGRIVILSTHIVSDVEYIAKTILVMKDGRLIHTGSVNEIIKAVVGKVWECNVCVEDADMLSMKYSVSNVRRSGDRAEVRVISDGKPVENAVSAEPTLEDLYLYYFK